MVIYNKKKKKKNVIRSVFSWIVSSSRCLENVGTVCWEYTQQEKKTKYVNDTKKKKDLKKQAQNVEILCVSHGVSTISKLTPLEGAKESLAKTGHKNFQSSSS